MMYSSRFSLFYILLSMLLIPFYSIFNGDIFSTVSESREKIFSEYATKIYTAAQNQYMTDKAMGLDAKECYSINEIGLSSTGDYQGYVCFKEVNNRNIEIYVSLHDDNYITYTKVGDKIYNYINYTKSGEPEYSEISSAQDNKSYITKTGIKFTNELKVSNNKIVGDYEI